MLTYIFVRKYLAECFSEWEILGKLLENIKPHIFVQ